MSRSVNLRTVGGVALR